jgi:hypothetical protein
MLFFPVTVALGSSDLGAVLPERLVHIKSRRAMRNHQRPFAEKYKIKSPTARLF